MKMIIATTIGNNWVQQKVISWSYLTRGRVARNQTKIKQKIHVLRASTTLCRFINVSFWIISGIIYPPINRIALRADISTILQYSARKKQTKHFGSASPKWTIYSHSVLSA